MENQLNLTLVQPKLFITENVYQMSPPCKYLIFFEMLLNILPVVCKTIRAVTVSVWCNFIWTNVVSGRCNADWYLNNRARWIFPIKISTSKLFTPRLNAPRKLPDELPWTTLTICELKKFFCFFDVANLKKERRVSFFFIALFTRERTTSKEIIHFWWSRK